MLPKSKRPLFDGEIPSTTQKIKYRQMLVKEQKILLMAKEGEDPNEILGAVKQVVNNCIIEPRIDIDKLSIFDLEWLFIQLHKNSVGSKVIVSYSDKEDDKVRDFDVQLDDVKIEWPTDAINNTIAVDDQIKIKMKYPPAGLYTDKQFLNAQGEELTDILVSKCIELITNGTEKWDASAVTAEELKAFVDDLPIETYDKIRQFLVNVPRLHYKIEYTNDKGTKREIVLSTLNDFFMLG